MLIVGITGSLSTGKSTASSLFARKGAKVLDADRIAHKLMEPRKACFRKVVKAFGPSILKGGHIDRQKIAKVVFEDKRKLRALEQIIHPAVAQEIKREIRRYQKSKQRGVLIIEVPLLFEAGLDRLMDVVVVVKASRTQQIARARERSGISQQEALRRIKAQMPLNQKIQRADIIIDNGGSPFKTKKQVDRIWLKLSQRIKK